MDVLKVMFITIYFKNQVEKNQRSECQKLKTQMSFNITSFIFFVTKKNLKVRK